MKFLIVICFVAVTVAQVVERKDESKAAIQAQELDVSPEGSYRYGFQSENGITIEAKGDIVNINGEVPSQTVQGQVQYTSPEGIPILLQYIADENGYQPQGDHLPTPPPIPEAILRALQYIRDHPPPVVKENI